MNSLENVQAPGSSVEITRWVEGPQKEVEIKIEAFSRQQAIDTTEFVRTEYDKLEFGLFDRRRIGGTIRLWRKRAERVAIF